MIKFDASEVLVQIQCFKPSLSKANIERKNFEKSISLQFLPNVPHFKSLTNILNTLYVKTGARMARMFMDLLRELDSTNYANP